MSEILTSDKLSTVAEEAIEIEEVAPAQEPEQVNYNEKSLSELVQLFEELTKKEDRLKLGKQADAIKSAFYKKLQAEKAAATDEVSEDLYSSLENGFKAVYETYRKERADWTAKLEKDKEANLEAKKAVIEDLKALLEKQEEINVTFPAFREIQNRWKAIGSVPQSGKSVYDEYQLYVEHFYDMVKINNELRELDFKKNLEVKTAFCEAAEKLAEEENVVAAFKELQKLHDQWKEYGPVAKEYRESIWDRFKAATAVVNKKYQEHFEVLKGQQVENLAKKEALCVKVEEIADKEISSLNEWTECSKQIEEIQKEWRTIGFATKKDNQKIYDRFRAACDKFYNSKKEYYAEYKGGGKSAQFHVKNQKQFGNVSAPLATSSSQKETKTLSLRIISTVTLKPKRPSSKKSRPTSSQETQSRIKQLSKTSIEGTLRLVSFLTKRKTTWQRPSKQPARNSVHPALVAQPPSQSLRKKNSSANTTSLSRTSLTTKTTSVSSLTRKIPHHLFSKCLIRLRRAKQNSKLSKRRLERWNKSNSTLQGPPWGVLCLNV